MKIGTMLPFRHLFLMAGLAPALVAQAIPDTSCPNWPPANTVTTTLPPGVRDLDEGRCDVDDDPDLVALHDGGFLSVTEYDRATGALTPTGSVSLDPQCANPQLVRMADRGSGRRNAAVVCGENPATGEIAICEVDDCSSPLPNQQVTTVAGAHHCGDVITYAWDFGGTDYAAIAAGGDPTRPGSGGVYVQRPDRSSFALTATNLRKATSVAAADITGDGTNDVAAIGQGSSGPYGIHVWAGDGAGNGSHAGFIPLNAQFHADNLVLVDADRDGNLDFYCHEYEPFSLQSTLVHGRRLPGTPGTSAADYDIRRTALGSQPVVRLAVRDSRSYSDAATPPAGGMAVVDVAAQYADQGYDMLLDHDHASSSFGGSEQPPVPPSGVAVTLELRADADAVFDTVAVGPTGDVALTRGEPVADTRNYGTGACADGTDIEGDQLAVDQPGETRLVGGTPHTFGFFGYSARAADQAIAPTSCRQYVDTSTWLCFVLVRFDGSGVGRFSVRPPAAALGFDLHGQGWTPRSGGSFLGQAALTRGLRQRVGSCRK